jgi:hypothetical protein
MYTMIPLHPTYTHLHLLDNYAKYPALYQCFRSCDEREPELLLIHTRYRSVQAALTQSVALWIGPERKICVRSELEASPRLLDFVHPPDKIQLLSRNAPLLPPFSLTPQDKSNKPMIMHRCDTLLSRWADRHIGTRCFASPSSRRI